MAGRSVMRRTVLGWAAAFTFAVIPSILGFAPATVAGKVDFSREWVISAPTARQMIMKGAVVLDAREEPLIKKDPLPGSVPMPWQALSLSPKPPKEGLLASDEKLTEKFQAAGVRRDVPVVVVADPIHGWGEDGRIVWTLRSRGHREAFLVDGGYWSLTRYGMPKIRTPKGRGDFVAHVTRDFEATRDEVKAAMTKKNVVIIDVREPREYAGETPYGESRPGHVPGATQIYYRELLDKNGYLFPAGKINDLLAEAGVDKAKDEVIAYCTGGVRAAFFTAVLADQGYSVKNYAGSMWDWASGDPRKYPLTH